MLYFCLNESAFNAEAFQVALALVNNRSANVNLKNFVVRPIPWLTIIECVLN